jgi:hypothetical protein
VSEFKTKRWFRAGSFLLTTGIRDVDRVAGFVAGLFPALYGEPQDYQLTGVFQS